MKPITKKQDVSSPSQKQQTDITVDSRPSQPYFTSQNRNITSYKNIENYNTRKRFNRTAIGYNGSTCEGIQTLQTENTKNFQRKISKNLTPIKNLSNSKNKEFDNKKSLYPSKTFSKLSKILKQNESEKGESASKIIRKNSQRASLGSFDNARVKFFRENNQNSLLAIEERAMQIKSSQSSKEDSMQLSKRNRQNKKCLKLILTPDNISKGSFWKKQQAKQKKLISNNSCEILQDYKASITFLHEQITIKDEQILAHSKLNDSIRQKYQKAVLRQKQLEENYLTIEIQLAQARISLQKKQLKEDELMGKIQQEVQINNELSKKYKQCQEEKTIANKQLKMFFDKRVPKKIVQLQSCREIYLEKAVAQLKNEINKNKSQSEKQVQKLICSLHNQLTECKEDIKNLQLHIGILNHRNQSDKKYLSKYEFFKSEYRRMKQEIKATIHQRDQLLQQNEIMRSQLDNLVDNIKLTHSNRQQQKFLIRVPSEAESLAFSLSFQS